MAYYGRVRWGRRDIRVRGWLCLVHLPSYSSCLIVVFRGRKTTSPRRCPIKSCMEHYGCAENLFEETIWNSGVKEGEWDRHSALIGGRRLQCCRGMMHITSRVARRSVFRSGRSVWPFTATAVMPRHKSVHPFDRPDLFGKGPSSSSSSSDLRFGFGEHK